LRRSRPRRLKPALHMQASDFAKRPYQRATRSFPYYRAIEARSEIHWGDRVRSVQRAFSLCRDLMMEADRIDMDSIVFYFHVY
jgi:hypothetical protein